MSVDVVLTGGGTGGHIYPGIAIADMLRERGLRVAFIGTADRLESTLVPAAGYELHTVSSRPLTRTLSPELVRTSVANLTGVAQSLALLGRIRPRLVIATGGYVCFPAVVAARIRGIPAALLEPNAHPGLTNRLLAPLVAEVWGAFPEADPRFAGRYVYTGIPVRRALASLPGVREAVERLDTDPQRRVLLVMGGSQGARSINDAVVALAERGGLPGWQVLLISGERDYERLNGRFPRSVLDVRPYFDDMTLAYAVADLIVCRAGASTLGELAAVGKPAILVPYPYAADDHQRANAETFARSGAALVIEDRSLAEGGLERALDAATPVAALQTLQRAARALRGADATLAVAARIDALLARKARS